MEEELEAAFGVAADLAPGDFAVVGDADFVGNVGFGELLFGFADEGNLRNGVDAVGIAFGIAADREAEGAGGGDAALLHGDGSQAGETDDVANGEDVRLLGTEIG